MKIVLAATLALALGGCLGVPVTNTEFNDDACLKRSVQSSQSGSINAGPPTGKPVALSGSKCRPVSSRRGSRGYYPGTNHDTTGVISTD